MEFTDKLIWGTESNSDLTEGRGRVIIIAISNLKATAIRLAKKAGVQGTDGDVVGIPVYKQDGKEFIELKFLKYFLDRNEKPEDIQEEKRAKEAQILEEKKARVLLKVKELGLTEDEINILKS